MAMGRTQVLVQLNEELLRALDERVVSEGVSRSELIRRAVAGWLADDIEASTDRRIVEGYRRLPAQEPAPWVEQLATASIEAEPW